MVAEFMIFYNWLAARFCNEHKILGFTDAGGSGRKTIAGRVSYIYYVFKQRRKLSPPFHPYGAKPHSSLGVDMYTTVTSPIRRYYDLLVQRQIKKLSLPRRPYYAREDLEKKRLVLDPLLKVSNCSRGTASRYWIQKYLAQHVGEKFPALVLDVIRNKYRVLLSDVQLIAEVKRENGQNLHEGQEIMVKIRKSNPWEDYLKVDIEKR